jgi:putative transposase
VKLKQVTLKKEPTGEWFATFGVELDRKPPMKPETPKKSIGIGEYSQVRPRY